MPTNPLIIAHRGSSAQAPENTLAAFNLALLHQADAIELDVHLSADHQVIVIHDATLDRTTDASGIIAALPAAQIQRANAAARFPGHPFEPVPTLRQVLEAIPPSTRLLIEIKAVAASLPVVHLLRQMGRIPQAVVLSFAPQALSIVHSVEPALAVALLFSQNIIKNNPSENARCMLAQARTLGTSIVDIKYPMATPQTVQEIHALGGQVWVWTPNTPQAMRAALDAHVDAITTNHPDQLRAMLSTSDQRNE